MAITTGPGSSISGGSFGLYIDNHSGKTEINVDGDVTADGDVFGAAGTAIYATNRFSGDYLTLTTGAGSTVTGDGTGIDAMTTTGVLTITAYGSVTGTDDYGIIAYNAAGTDITITTGPSSEVRGAVGIYATNNGYGKTTVNAYGDVTGTDADAISVSNTSDGTDIAVTVGTGATVMGAGDGISAGNEGSGSTTVIAYGDVTATDTGINVFQDYGMDVTVTTGPGTTITGSIFGIGLTSGGSGAVNVTTNGDVSGPSGIFVGNYTGNTAEIAVNAGSTVTSTGNGGGDFAVYIREGKSDITVAGTLSGARAVRFDQGSAQANLELQPSASIEGTVLAGSGTSDSLILAGTGEGTFDLSNIDTGAGTQQFRNFEVFDVVSGDWSFSGGTTQAFTVTGGTIMGTGTFGDLTLNNATLAPGNSIGTMIVNGAFTLGAGTVFEVEANAAGKSDKVIVTGTVDVTGATLRVLAQAGNYKLNTDYVIIDNRGSFAVAGRFAAVSTNLVFLIPSVLYNAGDGNDVVLSLARNTTLFSDVGRTWNQRAVAGAAELFPTNNPLFLELLTLTAPAARTAFNALSGEIHASVAGTLADDSRYARDAVMARLVQATYTNNTGALAALGAGGPQVASRDSSAMALGYSDQALIAPPAPAPVAFWTSGFGAWGDFDTDGNAASADRDLGGFVSGMDARIAPSWRVGLAGGASFSTVGVDARYSSASVESYHLGGYLGGFAGPLALRGGGMWAWNDIDTSRAVVFPGFYERQKSSYDGDTGQLFGEVAYPTQVGGIALEPFGGLAYVSVDTDTIRERGGALASLRGDASQDVGYSTLGLRAATTMSWGAMEVTPHVSAAWQHAFDDVTPDASLAIASTGVGFTIYGVPLAEHAALIDAGLDLSLGENTTAGVSYSGQLGDRVQDNAVKGRFTLLF